MSEHERFDGSLPAMSAARRSEARMAAGGACVTNPALISRDPVDDVSCRTGDHSCAAAHAGVLHRSLRHDSCGVRQSLLRLQMRYGNQYVGRVLNRASFAEAGWDGGGRGSASAVLQRQPEAPKPHDEEEKKKLLGGPHSGVRRMEDEQPPR